MQKFTVYNPKGEKANGRMAVASKIANISGAKIAFLDNLKPQSDRVLQGIADKLQKHGVNPTFFKKNDTPEQMPDSVIQQIKDHHHAMVTGVGD
jgi:hypothetical protein